ncbi:MAG TPA: hypothetical protein VFJ47_06190 [Terriglobales bacterium]|nr:hypothetical protein [Terriglobales bacterium]
MNSRTDSNTPRQSPVEIRRQGLMTQAMAKGRDNSRCDSCGLFWDSALRHVPLKDGGWVCLHCLNHPGVQRQYATQLAARLQAAPMDSSHATIPGVRRCALGSRCLRAEARRGFPVPGQGRYCSVACQGRARVIVRQQPAAVMVEV